MPSLFYLGFFLLALGTQAVLSRGSTFKIDIGNVSQCEPVFLSFTGNNTSADGDITHVQVAPVNGTAMAIAVPQVNVTDGGIQLSFVPVKADDTFMVTVDNQNGDNLSKVSDLMRVAASNNTSCLSPEPKERLFQLLETPRQCERFTVSYDPASGTLPTVRYFKPRDSSNPAKVQSDDKQGSATYMMDLRRGEQFMLMFQGGANNQTMETTALLTVDGDASSPTDCLNTGNGNTTGTSKSDSDKNKSKSGLSQTTVIGLAIGGSVLALLALVLVAYLLWERRNRRQVSIHFDPSLMEKRSLPASAPQSELSTPRLQEIPYPQAYGGYIQNPPYTAESLTRPSPSIDQMNRGSTHVPVIRHSPSSSMNSFQDIEGILNSQEQRVRDEQQNTALPSPTPSDLRSPGAPVVAVRALPARAQLTRGDSVGLSRNPSSQESVVDPYLAGNRVSSGLLQPPVPNVSNRSHFSAMTTSSFGDTGFYTEDRISGVPDSVSSPTSPQMPRRPAANGLGRGNGEPL